MMKILALIVLAAIVPATAMAKGLNVANPFADQGVSVPGIDDVNAQGPVAAPRRVEGSTQSEDDGEDEWYDKLVVLNIAKGTALIMSGKPSKADDSKAESKVKLYRVYSGIKTKILGHVVFPKIENNVVVLYPDWAFKRGAKEVNDSVAYILRGEVPVPATYTKRSKDGQDEKPKAVGADLPSPSKKSLASSVGAGVSASGQSSQSSQSGSVNSSSGQTTTGTR